MGGGLAGWFTPGWMVHEPRLAPHLNKKPEYIDSMLKAGEDPKPLVLEDCKPQCTFWKEKLERCEQQLEVIVKINPTKTCLYPMRDYATCVEACAQPLIHDSLEGSQ